jgi:dTDP-L-rhamnose 4-epimerase
MITPVAFRYQNVYGPGQSLSNLTLNFVYFSKLETVTVSKFLKTVKSLEILYRRRCCCSNYFRHRKEEANGEVFNVGTGKLMF